MKTYVKKNECVNAPAGPFTMFSHCVYGYNIRNELVCSRRDAKGVKVLEYQYQYDDIGNRITSFDLGTNRTYTANNLNQYTLISMSYDRMGRRVTKNNQRFVYDGYLCIGKIEDSTSIHYSLSPIHCFVWDPTEPIATRPLVFYFSNAPPQYYTHDGNKNVSDLIDISQSISAHYTYTPFGALLSSSGSSATINPFRFSSEYVEDMLNLVYYNYRHYNPKIGRWLCLDPLYEDKGSDLYLFCKNGVPISFDLKGLTSLILPKEPYFDEINGKKSVLISRYVITIKDPIKKSGGDTYFFRVAFVARFSPPKEIQRERISPNKIGELIWGRSASALGGIDGMYEPSKEEGDLPSNVWGEPTEKHEEQMRTPFPLRGERQYTYGNKKFQYGYFVYISRNGGAFEEYASNPDMYKTWRVGGWRSLVDDRDLSATGKMGRCDIVVVRHGDKGVAPKNVLIKGPGVRQ